MRLIGASNISLIRRLQTVKLIGSAAVALGCFTSCLVFSPPSRGQQPCVAPPSEGTAKGNIFSDQQEMYLGDAIAEQFEHEFQVVDDPKLSAYLDQIGQRVLVVMPPTQMKIRFTLIDVPTANAFTMPGGRIYVTRKLVVFAQNDNELAGVVGHELGHALTHQPAATFSRLLRQALGVAQVGDRADVYAKYNQLLENEAKKRLDYGRQEDKQEEIVADRYALYSLARAGYQPAAMPNFFDRLAQTGGKTGNWLSDLFGATKPDEQRLREMRQYAAAMPPACIVPHEAEPESQFRDWQAAVTNYSAARAHTSGRNTQLPGLLWERELSPPLESDITHVRFSPDGQYLLAQDDFSVYVLTCKPLQSLFRIPVENAEPATFTPDSQSVLIWTEGLHVEKWNIEKQSRTDTQEIVVQRGCNQSALSPDGAVLACVQTSFEGDIRIDLKLIDVATSTPFIEKNEVGKPSEMELFMAILMIAMKGHVRFMHLGFSPDGHYFAISHREDTYAWDLRTRAPLKINNVVREVMRDGFVFLGPDRVFGIDGFDQKKSGIAQFPSGPAGKRIPMNVVALSPVARGEFVIMRPAGEHPAGILDLATGKALVSQMAALDAFDNLYAHSRPDGSVALFDVASQKELASTRLPGHLVGWLGTASISQDLKWCAGSGESRGALWNLQTGERITHTRGFQGSYFADDDKFYADFPEHEKTKRMVGIVDPGLKSSRDGKEIDKEQETQYGPYLVQRKRDKGKYSGPEDIEVSDITTGTILWTKRVGESSSRVEVSTDGDEMAIVTSLSGSEAKDEEKKNAGLAQQVKSISSKDTASFVEVLDAKTGTLRGEFGIDTGKGSFYVHRVIPSGQWVVVTDNLNRILAFSLDGKPVARLFGSRPAPSASGRITFASDNKTLVVYDLTKMAEVEKLSFGEGFAHYEFVDRGTKLFVITEGQTAYLFDLQARSAN